MSRNAFAFALLAAAALAEACTGARPDVRMATPGETDRLAEDEVRLEAESRERPFTPEETQIVDAALRGVTGRAAAPAWGRMGESTTWSANGVAITASGAEALVSLASHATGDEFAWRGWSVRLRRGPDGTWAVVRARWANIA